MNVFAVLAEPTRRTIVEMLAERGPLSATEINGKFNASPPAISQHLKVLREAGIVRVEKRGQQRIYSADPSAMREVEIWIEKTKRMWEGRLDRMETLLKVEQ